MYEMKNSAILDLLISYAKNIPGAKGSDFTAERFVVAVIDYFTTNDVSSAPDAETRELSGLLYGYVSDLNQAKKTLMEYICSENDTALDDSTYIQMKLQDAEQTAKESGDTVLSAAVLLKCIFKSPCKAIKSVSSAPQGAPAPDNDPPPKKLSDLFSSIEDVLADELAALTGRRTVNTDVKKVEESAEAEDQPQQDTPASKSEMGQLVAQVKEIRSKLQPPVIFGQDHAINVFVTGYFQAGMLSMFDSSRSRPLATYLFAGPPGVGKTFLAETAANALSLPFKRFDMSEYADKEANIEFCGSDKVYKDAKSGNVTGFVAENPKCVLLFDEVEKAHSCVIHLFLQMLDAGRLRDNFTDEEVSFKDAIIIFTTNAGRALYEENEGGNYASVSRKVILQALKTDVNPNTNVPYFPAALCSRFASGNVVMFNHIQASDLCSIARKEIGHHASNLENATGIKIDIDEQVYTALLFSEGASADARTIKSRAGTFFNGELYELLRLIASEKSKSEIDNVESIRISVDLSGASADVLSLFRSEDKTKALVFSDEATVQSCEWLLPDVEVLGTQDYEAAVKMINEQSVDFVLLDVRGGDSVDGFSYLNVEDVESPARSLFKFFKEKKRSLPVYLMRENDADLSEEEIVSFLRQGVRGVLCSTSDADGFKEQLGLIAASLYQQASMAKLAKENKLVSFETAQFISENGENAVIRLFDFETVVAVDAADAKNILSLVSKPNVRFDQVIGAKDAKKELRYFVEYLRNPKKYMGTGVKAPRGVLLYGPPGTGKTMLAKAMACEAGVTFIAAEGNQFLKKYVGEGSDKVHEIFKVARKYAPSILFIDEIDAIGVDRQSDETSGGGVAATLTAFLTEMDGFVNDPTKPVFVLAATNFEVEEGGRRSLDQALIRRFDRRILIDLPNKEERIQFLRLKQAQNPALDISDEKIDDIALRATGMSLANLDSAVELALRSAIREGSTKVTDEIFDEAFETFNGGEAKKWDAAQLERVARHEAGHTLLCWLGGETPSYLTIVARGDHGGYMQHAEQEGKAIYTKDELLARIRTSLGGRAAEIVYYGERDGVSTGASGDLASATNTATHLVCTYGMDKDFGLAVVNSASRAGGELSAEVRAVVNSILGEQMAEAIRLVSENKAIIDALVAELMVKNHLNKSEIENVIAKARSCAV